MKYCNHEWSWGYELELGDVPRIPLGKLGSWEESERDIVNLLHPYQYVAADPLGKDPPVGGEINTRPSTTIHKQIVTIREIIEKFRLKGHTPTSSSCVMASHVHVHVPGLRDDIEALKRLTKYIGENQHALVFRTKTFEYDPLMAETKTAVRYLKWDLRRTMPDWMVRNILEKANDFDDFIRIQCCGKDGVSRGRPIRYCVNTYCLKHIDTIEFRCFKATLDMTLITNLFYFVRDFMYSALNGGPGVDEIVRINRYKFPPFEYDHEAYLGFEQTKWGEDRGKKKRTFVDVGKNQPKPIRKNTVPRRTG